MAIEVAQNGAEREGFRGIYIPLAKRVSGSQLKGWYMVAF